jgi:hypothetical protein
MMALGSMMIHLEAPSIFACPGLTRRPCSLLPLLLAEKEEVITYTNCWKYDTTIVIRNEYFSGGIVWKPVECADDGEESISVVVILILK